MEERIGDGSIAVCWSVHSSCWCVLTTKKLLQHICLKKHRDNPDDYSRDYILRKGILTSEQFEVAYNAFERTCNTDFNRVKARDNELSGRKIRNGESTLDLTSM